MNDKLSVGQFVEALRTGFINGLAFRSLHGTNCEGDCTILDKLHSLFRECDASQPVPSTNHSNRIPNGILSSIHVAEQIQKVSAGDMEALSVAYVSSLTARQVLCSTTCDACKAYVTSEVMLVTGVFIY